MGGSSKKKSSDTSSNPATQPALATFGQTGISPTVTDQLAAGGLLGAVPQPAGMYQQFQVPILRTPSDVEGYLISIGKKPVNQKNMSGSSSSKDGWPGMIEEIRKDRPSKPESKPHVGDWWK